MASGPDKVKQVYLQKGASLKMEDSDIINHHTNTPNQQILHYKRLVVPANMRSIYWKCYGFPANDENEILTKSKIICLLCKSTMTYNRNTTNLRMHLQNKHKNELMQLELMQPAPSNKKGDPDKRSVKKFRRSPPSMLMPNSGRTMVQGGQTGIMTTPTSSNGQVVQVFPVNQSGENSESQTPHFITDVDDMNPLTVIVKDSTSNSNYSFVDGKAIAEAIAEFVILDLQNPDIVEGKGFQRLIGTLKSPCEIPSKALLTEELIPKIYDVVKEQVLVEVDALQGSITLTVEDWLSSSGDHYSTVSIHFITARDNELQMRVLSTIYCSEVDPLHWGAQFDSILDEFHVKADKVKAIILASDRDDVFDTLAARGYIIIPCFSHALEVCAKNVLEREVVREVIKKCRALVAHISRNSTASAELRLQDNLLQLEESPLMLDNVAGWITTLSMIEALQARKSVLSSVLDCLNSTICPSSTVELTEAEWAVVDDVITVMSPFKVTVATLVEEKSPLISIMKPILSQLLNVHMQRNAEDSELLASFKTSLVEILTEKYRNEKVNEILELSSALDPRFKNLPFLNEPEKSELKKHVQSLLREQVDSSMSTESSKANLSKKRISGKGMEFLLGELVTVKTEMPSNQRSELEWVQYEWESQADLEKSPIEWWREMNGKCFHLTTLAWSFLCSPICSKGHLQHTVSPSSQIGSLPAQFALKLKFLHSNYVASSE